ncbi:ribosomal protection-like ABC-F family protein [Bacillus suaedae]|uniref:Ribosome protection protein VmlR n=1 Tax=Halalkalibacter suaedae TaxID=2822140 RepID=A0A940WSN5_9BACI|nr:ABC-F type ribosomal protection protein [Bacillus suaedae]MBP3951556.1 ABC-F type ribosomal protection protein [Bacillus suaedae]
MKELLKLIKVGYEVENVNIFAEVEASIQQRDVIGIIGKNGAGKSTLLQLLNNDLMPTAGQIKWFDQNLRITIVEQEIEEYTSSRNQPMEKKLLDKWRVPNHHFSQLSGGERLKARLAKGFSMEADLLLLDEPTNHLDNQSTELLKHQIEAYKGTIVFVSHDRYFLDAVATKIWSIEDTKLIEHKGNYSSYMDARKQKKLTEQREYEKQQKMIEQIKGQMSELESWSQKAHSQSTKKEGFKEHYRVKAKRMDAQIKSKQKRLEMELKKAKAERPELDHEVYFSLNANAKVGKRFLEVKNVRKAFGDRTLFENVNFTIQHGEKIAIIGPNGSGKTTFLKLIMAEETTEGEVWLSPSAKVGYLTQEVFDLPLEQTPEQLFYTGAFEKRGKIQTLMKHLGFSASQWTEPIKNMSMGERVKCKLMGYIIENKDVLILDEPTNHLDLPSREQLENTLAEYSGTLLIVSHDRYFLDKTTTSKLVLVNGSVQKQWKEPLEELEHYDEVLLTLETERQEVLGKLSYMTVDDKEYCGLDKRFKDLTKQINELK